MSLGILLSLSVAHCLNDTTQWLVIALYPLFRDSYSLSYTQLGLLSFAYQMTASVLQPVVGWYTDRRPSPWSLPSGLAFCLVGLVIMALAPGFHPMVIGCLILGMGSAIFHPESSRMAFMASGGHLGFAQSLFQLGGNAGQALGPLLAVLFVTQWGQRSLLHFSALPLVCLVGLCFVCRWAIRQGIERPTPPARSTEPPNLVHKSLALLFLLMTSKQLYTVSIANFFTFYLIHKFGLSVQSSQFHLFLFLAAVAAGTFVGGPIGDRIGRKAVIWVSILGPAPFALMMPYMDLFWTSALATVIGFFMASSFSAILVFAQELMPGRVGTVAGLFFGLAFGLGGLGAAVIGLLADHTDIVLVYRVCSFLPLMGLLTFFLPSDPSRRVRQGAAKG
jgi:FSR family fosmidomycin resistance protein-like MFS transporter